MAVDLDTTDGMSTYPPLLDRRLAGIGAALMTGGVLVWLAGASVGTVAVVSACRRYLAARDEPPRETARRRWAQARSATDAGLGAWQNYGRQPRPAER